MFEKHIRDFVHTLAALRSFADLVGPFLHSKRLETLTERAKDLAPLYLALHEISPDVFKDDGVPIERIRAALAGKITLKKDKTKDEASVSIDVKGPEGRAFHDAIEELSRASEPIELLFRSVLTSLVSSVECFLAQIIYTYYEMIPGAMSESDKVFSYNDLKAFDSVQDARVHLIERKVTDLMRGSFSEWIVFFKSGPKLAMSYLDPYMDVLVETCERRNLLIHNDGIVNSIYLSKVAPSLRTGMKKGSRIQLTKEYLDERINYFELYSVLIAAELWKKLKPGDVARADVLLEITYDHLLAKRWSVSQGLARFQMDDRQTPEPHRLAGTLNYWLSVKREGKWNSIKSDVEAADFSAKGMRYQLGLLSLQEKADTFFAMLPRAIKSGDINSDELAAFPIMEEMRRDSRMARFTRHVARSGKGSSAKRRKGTPVKGNGQEARRQQKKARGTTEDAP